MQIDVSITDIAKQFDMQAVVHSVNPSMRSGIGTAGPIHDAAGPELARHCTQFTPLIYGSAVLTPGFNLSNPYIIHASIASFTSEPEAEMILGYALESIMLLANQHQIESLAIPAIATGTLGCPPNLCAKLIAKLLAYYKAEGTSLKHIRICVGSLGLKQVFLQALTSNELI
jgi:O-acetyl-ADP-ribose deacetylase (regulator of RNase III)